MILLDTERENVYRDSEASMSNTKLSRMTLGEDVASSINWSTIRETCVLLAANEIVSPLGMLCGQTVEQFE